MKIINYIFLSYCLSASPCTIVAQTLDTLLHDFTFIRDITALDDGTFIIMGEKRGAVKVARINEKTATLWTRTLTDSIFYGLREYEVNMHENDSSIQIITHKNECDIIPPGIAYLFTIDFNGNIKDTVAIPFESGYETIFILSGIDSLPRCAIIKDDSVILKYVMKDDYIIDEEHELLIPRLVDMAPSGAIVVHYTIGSLRYYQVDGQDYKAIAGSFANPMAWKIIYAKENYVVLVSTHSISVIDSNGYEYGSFQNSMGFLDNIKWKEPYLYFKNYGFFDPDTFYVADLSLKLCFKDPSTTGKSVSDIVLVDSIIFRVGDDMNYPYPNGYIESEDLRKHILSKFYDVELVGYELGPADSFHFGKKCGQDHYLYYYPELVATIRNNGGYSISEVTIGYEENVGHCCTFLTWNDRITGMNLLPGETKNFHIPDFYAARFYPIFGPFNQCIYLSAPDNHPDDFYENNDACTQILPTAVGEIAATTDIQFYPNPSTGTIYFDLLPEEYLAIIIYDVNGHTLLKEKLNYPKNNIDLGRISSGVYFLKAISSERETSTAKLIRL